jgi:tetratricopeptide (TPR) repeat protein
VVIDRQGPRPGDEASAEGNDLRRTGRYAEALYSYKKALDTPGYAGGARDDLYAMYMDLERLPDGKEVLADAVRLFPRDTTPLFSLAEWYMRNREPEAAEPLFRDYIRRDPGRMLGYAGLGGALLALHRDKEALEAYKAAVRTNPRQDKKLYDMYMDLESMPGGGEVLVDAVRVFSNDAMPLFSLAEWYLSHNKPDAAEPLFRDYIRREPDKLRGYTGLGKALLALGKKEEALEVFRAALKASPRQDNRFYGLLAVQYLRQKDFRNAERYFDKVTDWNLSYPNPATVRNYAAVIAELLRRKIVPLCMQYPLRSLRPLKELAGDQAAGVVFVDNEESFKRYLRGHDYDELFSDQFAGDFGHCTDRGNTMIAENLARTIRAALKAK